MSNLFNYRFYRLINNSVRRRKFTSSLFSIDSNEVNREKRRFINTNKSDDKRVKNKSYVNKITANDRKNSTEFAGITNDSLKTLDINQMAFSITVTEMKRFLDNHNIKVSDGRTCLSIDCPFCASKANRLNSIHSLIDSKLFINKKTSNFICYSCEVSGTWISLVELISNLKSGKKGNKTDMNLMRSSADLFGDRQSEELLKEIIEKSQSICALSDDDFTSVINTFGLNGFTKSSLKYFDVRVSKGFDQLILPFKSCYDKNRITALKVIELKDESERTESNRYVQRIIPNDTKLSIFGLNQHLAKGSSADHLVITDSPIDAMAVTQQTGLPSVSLPLTGISSQLRPEVLPFLEAFNKVNICYTV